MSKSSNRVIKNTLYLYIRMGISIVFSFFTTRILLHALGASDYGLYNVVAGLLAMLGFLSASMSSTTQRFISYAEGEGNYEKIKSIFNNAHFLHNIIAIIVAVILVVAGLVFFNGVLNIPEDRKIVAVVVYACMIISTVFAITIVPYDAVLNAHENMLFYSLLGIFDVLIKFAIAIAVLFSKSLDKLLLYGMLMAIESWLFRFITKQYCIRIYNEVRELNRKKYVEKGTLKEMISFAGWNMMNISSGMISFYGISIILNHFFGTILNASLGIAQQLSGVLLNFSSNMTKAITPVMVKAEGSENHAKMINISIIGCKFSYILFSFMCLPVVFCLKPILNIWLNNVPDWTELFCLLMIISSLLEQLSFFLYQSINAHGNIRNYNITRTITNILPIILTCIEFMMSFPPYFALVNWIIFKSIIGGIINIYYSHKNFGFPIRTFFIEVFYPLLFSSFLISIFCYLVMPEINSSPIQLIVHLFLMYIGSAAIIWFISISSKEKNLIKTFFKKKQM